MIVNNSPASNNLEIFSLIGILEPLQRFEIELEADLMQTKILCLVFRIIGVSSFLLELERIVLHFTLNFLFMLKHRQSAKVDSLRQKP